MYQSHHTDPTEIPIEHLPCGTGAQVGRGLPSCTGTRAFDSTFNDPPRVLYVRRRPLIIRRSVS
jgi:hypothetical protein